MAIMLGAFGVVDGAALGVWLAVALVEGLWLISVLASG